MKDAEEEKMEERSTVDKDSNLDEMMEFDKVVQKPVDKSLIQLTGRVVDIIKRNWRPYCAILLPLAAGGSLQTTRKYTFIPANRWIPHVRLETRQASILTDGKENYCEH